MKRGKFESGDLAEITRGGKYAYCRALKRDSFGMLFEILEGIFEKPIASLDTAPKARKFVCYINEVSVKINWRYAGRLERQDVNVPPVFNGHPSYSWTVYYEGKEKSFSAKTTELELMAQGFVPRVLWLTPKVEDYIFDGVSLIWKWS